MDLKTQKVKRNILNNKKNILDFFKNYQQYFEDYFFIAKKVKEKNIDEEFRQTFRKFYQLNGVGLSREVQNRYLDILEECIQNNNCYDFRGVIEKLYEINGRRRVELAFTTKILHTINNDLPLYDQNIANALPLPSTQGVDFEEKIKNRKNIYEELQKIFVEMLKNEEINEFIEKFREHFGQALNYWEDVLISDTKILDCALWYLGGNNRRNDNNKRTTPVTSHREYNYQKVARYIVDHYKEGDELTTREIGDITERLGINRQNFLPSDYCDNHTNRGAPPYYIFRRLGQGRYKVLNHDKIKRSCNLD